MNQGNNLPKFIQLENQMSKSEWNFILVAEETHSWFSLRVVMVVLQVFFGFLSIVWAGKLCLFNKSIPKNISISLILSLVFHTIHFAHNIYNPVTFREPKPLYDSILVTEMDKMFIYFWLLCFLSQVIGNLFNFEAPRYQIILASFVYCMMSLASGLHYLDKEVTFSFLTNLVIVGECVSAILFFVLVFLLQRKDSSVI